MRKIVLFPAEFVVTDGLSYDQACEAMEKANKHSVGSRYNFFICSDNIKGWTLMARDISWSERFISIPTDFIIEVQDEKVS